jgi:hypothetical protein
MLNGLELPLMREDGLFSKKRNPKEILELILLFKNKNSFTDMMKEIKPVEHISNSLGNFFEIISSLKYDEKPDYSKLRKIL